MSLSSLSDTYEQMKRVFSPYESNLFRASGMVINRGFLYLRRWLHGNRTFQLGDDIFTYKLHPLILNNERAVEIPVAMHLVDRHAGGRILEVGNVLSAYAKFEHTIVDKYEKASRVINVDIVDYHCEQPFDLILCLSTLEHVGWDETPRDESKVTRALQVMTEMLAPGGELLVTMPIGYNTAMDRMLDMNALPFTERRFLKRVSSENLWTEAQWEEVREMKYGTPYSCANAIVVGWVRK